MRSNDGDGAGSNSVKVGYFALKCSGVKVDSSADHYGQFSFCFISSEISPAKIYIFTLSCLRLFFADVLVGASFLYKQPFRAGWMFILRYLMPPFLVLSSQFDWGSVEPF